MAQSMDGTVLKSVRQVNAGDRITVRLGEGALDCTVNHKGDKDEHVNI